jgi:hypothetical protein
MVGERDMKRTQVGRTRRGGGGAVAPTLVEREGEARAPQASKYADYEREAVRGMLLSRDPAVVRAAQDIKAGVKHQTDAAIAAVKRRLIGINSGTSEAAALRLALVQLKAMHSVEQSSWVGEHQVPGAERTQRSPGAERATLVARHRELTTALRRSGLRGSEDDIEAVAVMLSMAARGASLEDVLRRQPFDLAAALTTLAKSGALVPGKPTDLGQWIDFTRSIR